MKKPKKLIQQNTKVSYEADILINGYNQAIDEMDAYHAWDIENNYVAKSEYEKMNLIMHELKNTIYSLRFDIERKCNTEMYELGRLRDQLNQVKKENEELEQDIKTNYVRKN